MDKDNQQRGAEPYKNKAPQDSQQPDAGTPAGHGDGEPGEDLRRSVRTGLRGMFAKRWTFPALYLTAAVLIIALMYFQANHTSLNSHPANGAAAPNGPTVTTTAQQPSFAWPVAQNVTGVQLLRGYYDRTAKGATVASLAKDLVHYGNSYTGSTGYDLGNPTSHAVFPVTAAAAGTVTSVRDSKVMGQTVEVSDADGYTTVYQSLGKVSVKDGQHVAQGQAIGTSGANYMEASLGNHLFFAIEKNGVTVDPASLLPNSQI